ncbi:MAG TPA: phage holin family protein [Candidatus Limnocylindria bacterium]
MTQVPPPRQSMIGVVRQLVNGVIELARLEVTRGRQELGQMADDVKAGLLLMGVAFGLLFMALMVLLIFVVTALAAISGLPQWVIALFALVFLIGTGGLLAFMGIKRIRVGPPEETIQAVQEDIEWAKRLLRRG